SSRGTSMKRNACDDPGFFEAYRRMRENPASSNVLIEQPALRASLPPLQGLEVLDLGCGMGHLSLYLAEQGASRVLAIDASERMIEVARSERPHARVEYTLCAMQDLTLPQASFDLVTSSLAIHYVADYGVLVRGIVGWLRPGGHFVYSVEHPMKTAPSAPDVGWVEGGAHWPVDSYCEEGARERSWFAGEVVKYHRKVATLVNTLVAAGMTVERLEEPEEVLRPGWMRPAFPLHRHRPSVLVIGCAKRF
ncbi:MAG: class I SAM-dependent methyltransferase, partial [Rubrobacter sp.]